MKGNSLKKGITIGIFSILFIISIQPSIACISIPQDDTVYSKNLPTYYTITIIRCHGIMREKSIKRVNHEDAMTIKNEYSLIEKNTKDPSLQIKQKHELLKQCGIISEDENLDSYIHDAFKMGYLSEKDLLRLDSFYSSEYSNPLLLGLIGFVFGTFSGITLNVLNFILLGLFLFIKPSEGFISYSSIFTSNVDKIECRFFFSYVFFGIITLIPFIDPDGGSIEGLSIITIAA